MTSFATPTRPPPRARASRDRAIARVGFCRVRTRDRSRARAVASGDRSSIRCRFRAAVDDAGDDDDGWYLVVLARVLARE